MKKNVLTPLILIVFLLFIGCSDETFQEDISNEDFQTEEISGKKCSTTLKSNKLKETDLEYLKMSQLMKTHAISYVKELKRKELLGEKIAENVIEIPVVVHNLWLTQKHKFTRRQIQDQINVLTVDFNLQNPVINQIPAEFQHLKADIKVRFRLARVIKKKVTKRQWKAFYRDGDLMKRPSRGGSATVDPIRNLNIWVGNQDGGYAYFPGVSRDIDGVVLGHKEFGLNNKNIGRVATHEVGHYLGLDHVWGPNRSSNNQRNCDQDDGISDTPPTIGTPFDRCVAYPRNTCGSNDMTMNFMDYTRGDCVSMFTLEQKSWMRSHFAPGGFREAMAN
ncbi:M43 family zinc metalloprotease [Aquimarina sp. 2201CG5-10]|uniref:M43 family zinc metalloprotease n=1 Tax=Aquimarina callyspongiae TaxID=3098150 RepID=UPI002AB55529|nr:M43 family zinc metalloprotease [Aquimarina sp. 2201CG5-10]MDY8138768.1 M43 family zinc metalloprotease [Aquimarina sp. 2201CG5-10]